MEHRLFYICDIINHILEIDICRRSSGVEHTLGKGGVGSSILLGGTIKISSEFNQILILFAYLYFLFKMNKYPPNN